MAGTKIANSERLKSLGVTLDQSLTFDQHVQCIVKASNSHIRALRHIRPMLDRGVTNTIACSIVSTKFHYCNSLLHASRCPTLRSSSASRNSLANIVAKSNWRHHMTPVLKDVHWMPVTRLIKYQVALSLVTQKVFETGQLGYLLGMLALPGGIGGGGGLNPNLPSRPHTYYPRPQGRSTVQHPRLICE